MRLTFISWFTSQETRNPRWRLGQQVAASGSVRARDRLAWLGVLRGDVFDLGFHVLAEHFVVDDRVPGGLPFAFGHVMFACPAAQPQLLDKIHFRRNATHHDFSLGTKLENSQKWGVTSKYSGSASNGKDLFWILAEIPPGTPRLRGNLKPRHADFG